MLDVTVNGKDRSLSNPISVSQLIREMDLQGKRIAVEINGEIIPASQHSSYLISNHDRIEIVGAIGGG
jgi:sulfur carrier protein